MRPFKSQTLINTSHYSHLQFNAKKVKYKNHKSHISFHVSLNIFICDKHNILVLQDITQQWTLLNNIYKPMYKQIIIQI